MSATFEIEILYELMRVLLRIAAVIAVGAAFIIFAARAINSVTGNIKQ